MLVLIFYMSAQDGSESSNSSGVIVKTVVRIMFKDFESLDEASQTEIMTTATQIIRKVAHFTEYFLLSWAAFFHFTVINERVAIKRKLLWTFLFSALYAVSDEIHQLFVPGRSGNIKDVVIDCMGALLTVVIILLIRLIKEEKNKRGN